MVHCKIVTDSSSDLYTFGDHDFAVAPLRVITSEKEYIDDCHTDVHEMIRDLMVYKGKSSTSCPNAEDWLNAFGDAECVICVTITGTLSGCYNAACIAKSMYEEQYKGRKVFVLNSLTTGPEMRLIVEKIAQLQQTAPTFEDLCESVRRYTQKTGLLFVLESMRNLANNGRVNPIVARAAGLLGVRVVGKANEHGDLQMLAKCRGEEKALAAVLQTVKAQGDIRKVHIAHCENEGAAMRLKERLSAAFERATIQIYPCGALCSFYAEAGGLLIGYEAE